MNRVSSQMAAGVLFLLTTVSALGAPPSTRQLCGLHADEVFRIWRINMWRELFVALD